METNCVESEPRSNVFNVFYCSLVQREPQVSHRETFSYPRFLHIQLSLNLPPLQPKSLLKNIPVQETTSACSTVTCVPTHWNSHQDFPHTQRCYGILSMAILPSFLTYCPLLTGDFCFSCSDFPPPVRWAIHPTNGRKHSPCERVYVCEYDYVWAGMMDLKKVRDCWHGRWECFHLVTWNSTEIGGKFAGWIT